MGQSVNIKTNWENFEKDMNECLRVNLRNHSNCQCIVVSKRHPLSVVMDAYKLGIRHFGESQVQEGTVKVKASPEDTVWHFIGHLQKNKVRKAVQYFDYIHSIDSLELLDRVVKIAEQEKVSTKVFLQVNLLRIPGRFGFYPEDLPMIIENRNDCKKTEVIGLMGMKPLESELTNRAYFELLRDTRDELKNAFPDWPGMISAGMSGDFEDAIAMGSNFLRIGTRILGTRD